MLSIGKLTGGAGSASYYEQAVATGREDYHSGRGESAGQWVGDGAQALGIEGSISEGDLQEWMGHRDFATTLIYADYAPSAHEADLVDAAFGRSDSVTRDSALS